MNHYEPSYFNELEYDWRLPVYDTNSNFILERMEEELFSFCTEQMKNGTFTKEMYPVSTIKIDAPEKIITDTRREKLILPLAVFSFVSGARMHKYFRTQVYSIIHIKNSKGKEIYTGELYDFYLKGQIIAPSMYPPMPEELLDDSQLEVDPYVSDYLTVNVMDYLNFPLKNGYYEIFCSQYNLESNHVKVYVKRFLF